MTTAGLGVTAAGIGLGIGALVAYGAKNSDASGMHAQLQARDGTSACKKPANSAACGDLKNAYDAARTLRNLGIIGFVVGGAATIFTTTYMMLPGGKVAAVGVRAAASVGPGGGGVVVLGDF